MMAEDGNHATNFPSAPPRIEAGGEYNRDLVPWAPPQIDDGDEDSHVIPLAPATARRINRQRGADDEDEQLPSIKPKTLQQQKSSKCLVYVLAAVVITSIFLLILGLTILRADSPELRLKTIQAKNLRYATAPSASLDMNMVGEITVENTNFGPFRFRNSSSSVLYGNVTLGMENINEGVVVGARDTKRLNVTVGVRSSTTTNSSLLSWLINNNNTNFSSDIGSGMVPLRSVTKLRGEVETIKIFNSKRTALLNCTMSLNLTSQAFQDLRCN